MFTKKILVAALFAPCLAFATTSTPTGSFELNQQSVSSASVVGTGTSLSTSGTTGAACVTAFERSTHSSAEVGGSQFTKGTSFATNISTGSGTGSAGALSTGSAKFEVDAKFNNSTAKGDVSLKSEGGFGSLSQTGTNGFSAGSAGQWGSGYQKVWSNKCSGTVCGFGSTDGSSSASHLTVGSGTGTSGADNEQKASNVGVLK